MSRIHSLSVEVGETARSDELLSRPSRSTLQPRLFARIPSSRRSGRERYRQLSPEIHGTAQVCERSDADDN